MHIFEDPGNSGSNCMENHKRGTDTDKQEDNWFISVSTIKFKQWNTGKQWIADWFLKHFL